MTPLTERLAELVGLPGKWRERVDGVKKVEAQARENGFKDVADMLKCVRLEQSRCADELEPLVSGLDSQIGTYELGFKDGNDAGRSAGMEEAARIVVRNGDRVNYPRHIRAALSTAAAAVRKAMEEK